MDRRPHRLATPLVAGVVVLVVGAAVGASLADDGSSGTPAQPATADAAAPTTTGPGLGRVLRLQAPAPGAFSGTLLWNRIDCSTGTLDLSTGTAARGLPARACSMWSAADGRALAFTRTARAGAAG